MKKQYFKYCLDIAMTICFICIMKIMITGMSLHEKLGLIIGGLVILHSIFNYKWIKGITLRAFDKKLNLITKISLILNLILAVFTVLVIVSGILISVTIFKEIAVENRQLWAEIHKKSSLILFICISIHIGLHWKMIMFGAGKMFRIHGRSSVRTYLLRSISIIIILFGLLALINNPILQNILNIKRNYNLLNNTGKLQAIMEYISIMGLFIGGTYYTLKITNKNRRKKTN